MTYTEDHPWQLLINGDWVDPATGTYPIINPYDLSTVGHAPEANITQATDAAAAATAALPAWRDTPIEQRCALLDRLADIVTERAQHGQT